MIRHVHYWQKIRGIGTILLILGFVGGVALRLTIFVRPFGEYFVDIIWYTGVIAYALFYAVRISIERHRREVCQPELLKRLKNNSLSDDDIFILHDMISSHCRSKVKYNYVIWLLISIVSILAAIFITP